MSTEKIVDVKGSGQKLSLNQLRNRMATYNNEIRQLLESHEAAVETYRFSVEKEGDGFVVDVAVKASIHPKNRAGISK
jgi:ribosome-interacting GTPase 1